MIQKYFLHHPESVGESYGEHLVQASGFGLAMLAGAGACFIHALIPGLFERTASGVITGLHGRMVTHRTRTAA
jgi:hypothetical protein